MTGSISRYSGDAVITHDDSSTSSLSSNSSSNSTAQHHGARHPRSRSISILPSTSIMVDKAAKKPHRQTTRRVVSFKLHAETHYIPAKDTPQSAEEKHALYANVADLKAYKHQAAEDFKYFKRTTQNQRDLMMLFGDDGMSDQICARGLDAVDKCMVRIKSANRAKTVRAVLRVQERCNDSPHISFRETGHRIASECATTSAHCVQRAIQLGMDDANDMDVQIYREQGMKYFKTCMLHKSKGLRRLLPIKLSHSTPPRTASSSSKGSRSSSKSRSSGKTNDDNGSNHRRSIWKRLLRKKAGQCALITATQHGSFSDIPKSSLRSQLCQ